MMKSGMNIADVYIHTPSRINSTASLVSLATMLSKTMDVVLEEARPLEKGARTMETLANIHANTLVKYDRAHDRLSVMGHPGATSDVFSLLERLSIDPVYLLSH